jgi:amino acid transporter
LSILGCSIFKVRLFTTPDMILTSTGFLVAAIVCAFFLLVGWIVYRLDQRAARTRLMPLRDELANAMKATNEDTVLQEHAAGTTEEPKKPTERALVLRLLAGVIGLTVLLGVAGAGAFYWAFPQAPTLEIAPDANEATRLDQIDQWLAELHQSGQFNGGVLIARDGKPTAMQILQESGN